MVKLAQTYTTIQGETWDEIAYKVYGDEKYATFLMASNYPLLDVLIFSSGTVLHTPDLPGSEGEELPPWRNEAEDGGDGDEPDPYDDFDDEDEAEGGG